MNERDLRELLHRVGQGQASVDEAVEAMRPSLEEVTGIVSEAGEVIARIDHDRERRCGAPEVILGSAKRPQDLPGLMEELLGRSGRALVTRVDAERMAVLHQAYPEGEIHERARCFLVDRRESPPAGRTGVLILSAGTGDLPVAEEARVAAVWMGEAPVMRADVGVAGIHRLFAQQDALAEAHVVIVVAGMEGALPSVVGGLVDVPVLAVPTSVGYGTSLEGITPLLAMMSGCAPGVAVLNIDNGFGAGVMAALINRQIAPA